MQAEELSVLSILQISLPSRAIGKNGKYLPPMGVQQQCLYGESWVTVKRWLCRKETPLVPHFPLLEALTVTLAFVPTHPAGNERLSRWILKAKTVLHQLRNLWPGEEENNVLRNQAPAPSPSRHRQRKKNKHTGAHSGCHSDELTSGHKQKLNCMESKQKKLFRK